MTASAPSALGAYRQPDASRLREIDEARRAEETETRRVVAAMKSPWHGLKQNLPRGLERAALLTSVGAIVGPFLLLFLKPLLAGPLAGAGRDLVTACIFLGGSTAGTIGMGLGFAGLVGWKQPFASAVAVGCGLFALPWCLVCAFVFSCRL